MRSIFRSFTAWRLRTASKVSRRSREMNRTRRRADIVERDLCYPLIRFPWREVRAALGDLAGVTPRGEAVRLAYVNPETGGECMPILGFSAIELRPGEELRLPRHSASSVLNVVEGGGAVEIDGESFHFEKWDTLAVPTHAEVKLQNASTQKPAYLFVVDDSPMQKKLGFYELFG
jgi:gentisate 1,2-dioxygenase